MSKILTSQWEISTSNNIVITFSHYKMEVESNFYGFYNKITNGNKVAWFNHGYSGQTLKGNSFYSNQVHL